MAMIAACLKTIMVLAAAALVLACTNGESNVETGLRDGTLHVGNTAEPQSLDPHVMTGVSESNIASTLFEGLVSVNPYTLEPEPAVAESWTLSEDKRVISLQLNPAARWSNGDQVTAQDFVWSWQRALNPLFGNQNAFKFFPIRNAEAYFNGTIADPNEIGVKALDTGTLQITLNDPTPYFILLLDDYSLFPVHRPTIERFGEATDRFTQWTRVGNIVSNGPFELSKWQLNRRLTVTKSESYWDADRVRLNKIVFHPIDSPATEERMFRAGQLHITDDVPLGKIDQYETGSDRSYRQAPYLGTYYFMFNTTRAPMDDIRVRQALAMAIDRETLASTILQDVYLPSYSLTPPGIPGYEPPRSPIFNPEAARKLLADAGYPDGQGWPGLELTYNTRESHHKVAVAVQQMWKQLLNIDITITNFEWKVYLDTLAEMDYEMARAAWIGGYLDPSTFLAIFITNGGNNRTGFASDRYDELVFQLADKTTLVEDRYAVFKEAESILISQMPIIPLFSYTSRHLIHPTVHGIPPNILDLVDYRYVWLESPAP